MNKHYIGDMLYVYIDNLGCLVIQDDEDTYVVLDNDEINNLLKYIKDKLEKPS